MRGSTFRVPIKTNSHLTISHIQGDEYLLNENDNLLPIEGFNAGHGMDMVSMKKIWHC